MKAPRNNRQNKTQEKLYKTVNGEMVTQAEVEQALQEHKDIPEYDIIEALWKGVFQSPSQEY